MKKFDSSDYAILFYYIIILIAFASVSVIGIARVITTQQALNQECKTNYNFMQVALAGDNLSRICQIKNQTMTVK